MNWKDELKVRLIYTFQDRTDTYLVMEYCENGDLLKVISELQQVPEEERIMRECGIFGQMIRALDFLHCNGIIHQDIKPENIFVMIDGCDFGHAQDLVGDYYFKEEGTKSPLPQRAHPRRQNRIRELSEEDRPVRNQKRHSQITTGIARKIKKRLIASKRLRRLG
ncbi:MAG: hypothetical protein EZS28_027474 [Streblomastix strix]|uniref:non-specific serine/threonine protein kinase n=1 Tax=Streblomastix strix TaxID=222440 RepID=A0A5J4V4E8_9EUKA|nr:MAG: hypothetical protein EZS28_027474 [Streblomastix strix]